MTIYGSPPSSGQSGGSPYPPPGSGQPPFGPPPYGQQGYGQQPVPPPPPPEKKSWLNLSTKLSIGFFAALLVAAVIQGATVQQIGFGPFSVSFGKSDSGNASGNGNGSGSGSNGSQPGGGSGNTPGDGSGGGDGSGSGSGSGGNPVTADATVKGAWSATRVSLTIVISQVDVQQGHLRLHLKVTNDADGEVTLPLFGYCNATDDKDTTYNADPQASSMPVFTAPGGGGFVTGIIELTPTVTAGATSLTLNFTTIFGFGSPGGGISVSGIPIPH